jgi:hypothetical protein
MKTPICLILVTFAAISVAKADTPKPMVTSISDCDHPEQFARFKKWKATMQPKLDEAGFQLSFEGMFHIACHAQLHPGEERDGMIKLGIPRDVIANTTDTVDLANLILFFTMKKLADG